jgi:hypothetical protein
LTRWKWWVPSHLLKAVRVSVLLVEADDAMARDKPTKAWRMLQTIERVMGQNWPINGFPPDSNLVASRVALGNGHYRLAHECALEAERQLRNPPDRTKYLPADRTYLIYYAVMLSRWARRDLGETLPDKVLYYPPMSDTDVESVDPRLRRQFPLVKDGTAP